MKLLHLVTLLAASISLAADAPKTILDIPLKDIDGKDTTLGKHKGKVLLLVNVASKCGLTPQYTTLQLLQDKYKDLVVCGFPSNDFGGQEPGTNEEIKTFCTNNFNVTFPMFEKITVKGPGQHPLFAALTGPSSPHPGDVPWNFSKFLIGRDGTLLQRFDSQVDALDEELTGAIEKALQSKEK